MAEDNVFYEESESFVSSSENDDLFDLSLFSHYQISCFVCIT